MSKMSGLGSAGAAWPTKDDLRGTRIGSRADGGELKKRLFDTVDADRSGTVDAGEFKAGMKALLAEGTSTLKFATGRQPPIIIREDSAGAAPQGDAGNAVKQLMAAIDSNGNGRLGRRELAAFGRVVTEVLAQAAGPASPVADAVTAPAATPTASTAGGAAAADPAAAAGLPRDAMALARLLLQRYQMGFATGTTEPVESSAPRVSATA